MKSFPPLLLFTALSLTCIVRLQADDANWAQWRGPAFNGTAPGANPPTEWSETSNIKWKIKTPGRGVSTPIIWGDSIFIQTAIGTGKKVEPAAVPEAEAKPPEIKPPDAPPAGEQPNPEGRRNRPGGGGGGGGGRGRGEKPTEVQQFVLLCLDRATGSEKWRKVASEVLPHEGHHQDHGYASHSPVTDGEHVYAWFGSRGLYCYDMKGGLVWSKEFGKMKTRAGFGEGSSPALHGDTIIINWDHEEDDDFIVALDKKTGQERWKQKRDEASSWTTPLVLTHEGKTQVVVNGAKRIRSYDLVDGKLIWECGGMTQNVIPTPVSANGILYAISGFRGASLMAIKLGQTGDLTDKADAIAWKHNKRTPYVPSPLLYGDKLYFFAGNDATLSCFDAKTGEPMLDAQDLEGLNGLYASPAGAADRVYIPSRNGVTVVLKNTGKLDILATNKLDDGFDSSPAIVGKEIFLRGRENLYCIAEK